MERPLVQEPIPAGGVFLESEGLLGGDVGAYPTVETGRWAFIPISIRIPVRNALNERIRERSERRFRSDLSQRDARTERVMTSYADFCSTRGKEMIFPR